MMFGTFGKLIKGVLLGACAFALLAPAAFAQDAADVTVAGGLLDFTASPTAADFVGITLDGTTKTTTSTLDDFEVNDARGTGDGWHVSAEADQFAEHDGTIFVVGGKTLPVGSLSMTDLDVTADGTSSGLPTVLLGAYTIDAGAVQVASAAVGDGMGRYDFTDSNGAGVGLILTVLPDAYAATYRSTVTITIDSGP